MVVVRVERQDPLERFLCLRQRLLNACSPKQNAKSLLPFEVLFELLRHIDSGSDDVIFFADEGGSYEVRVEWEEVLPSWFKCLSATAGPKEYARKVVEVIDEFASCESQELPAEARRVATPEQVRAFKKPRRRKK